MTPVPAVGPLVLIVDDDAGVRDVVAELLADDGFRVTTASNGQEALEKLWSMPAPALILLNLRMPVMNGWAFRSAMRQSPELRDIPVVIVSGSQGLPETALDLEASGYLPKPLDVAVLLSTVRGHCFGDPHETATGTGPWRPPDD